GRGRAIDGQRVGVGAAVDGVLALADREDEAVVAGKAREIVVAARAVERIGAVVALEVVVPLLAGELVGLAGLVGVEADADRAAVERIAAMVQLVGKVAELVHA